MQQMSHQLTFCSVCNVRCDTEKMLRLHQGGKKHLSKCMALTGSNTWDHSNPIRIALPTLSTPESVSPQGSHWNVNFCLPETVLNSTSNVESSFDIDCDVKWTEPRSNQSSSSSSSSGMDFFCSCCDVKMNSSAQMAAHIRGRKHQSKAASCSIDSPVRSATAMSDDTESESVFYRCDDCQAVLFTSAKAEHLASAEHRSNACGRNRRALSIGPSVKNLLHLRKYQRSCREALTPVWSSVTFTGLEARLLEEAAKGDDDCVIHLDSLGGGRSRVGLHLAHALLAANRNPSSTSFLDNPSSKCMPTCIVWIVPTVQEPSSGFSSVFKLLPNIEESSTERRLIFAYPPLDMETVFQTDVILTSPDSFVKYVSKLVMQQRFVCGIIIENVDLVSKDREFVKLLCNYLQVYTDQVNRGRIICFNGKKVEAHSIFSSFTVYS